ncbi:tetratricopeptide repeat protein [Nesterenkonia sandarakina]|uniref:Tetratricopeptide (TPR) repeat protein n=1 Tax=Nesterenkonia sandarakina TaxID=272918 RepID=A0A7Z0EAU1_9MICC|nr:tetratricopeptide repeat protein [Nesterenkonia sandarakina]NYJ18174.1 tetratricopeptide (TPR) repeat protein [Nesterenkonia sandarakina]
MTKTLNAQLDAILAARDRENMTPTLQALLPIYEQYPNNPRVFYELGGAYDTAGEEATALGLYEDAMAEGLTGEIRRRCYLQYGSTLRNLGRFEDSSAVFSRARSEFPESAALAVFESLTLHAAGRAATAVASLLTLLSDRLDDPELHRYEPAIRDYAQDLFSLDAEAVRPAR